MIEENNFGKIEDYEKIHKKIFDNCKKLRGLKKDIKTDWSCPAEMHLRKSTLRGKDTLTLTITLSPFGCEWARKGGCTMCGEFESISQRQEIANDPKFHISQFVSGLTNENMWSAVKESRLSISRLRIYQEGNYTNTNETSKIAQIKILKLATLIKGLEKVTIEARPQYIKEDIIKEFYEIFKDSGIELEIGMGLEAKNDVVRNVCINKAGTENQFKNAIKIMQKYNISPLAYILLKPPFLTEREAIIEAISTVKYANELGFKRISLEPMSIHGFTLVDALKQNNLYSTPWFWSVIKVLEECQNFNVRPGVGGIGYFPLPEEFAQNKCKKCNKEIIDAIIEYNKAKKIEHFKELKKCECYEKWLNEINYIEKTPLRKRIENQIYIVEKNINNYKVSKHKKVESDARVLYEQVQNE
ncbi:MAG: hypothetical protein HFG90_02070 [Acholeplasmatales bacterium]|jgi:hypothetical protein|nr:hypothetical protein [Acholeplasmatales bacterium]